MPKSIGIIGKKIGMTRIFSETGAASGVTIIKSGPCVILQVKTEKNDGYNALQLGFIDKPKKITKSIHGHIKKTGEHTVNFIKEFKCINIDNFKAGQIINFTELFRKGDLVDIRGVSKGKGFQGVVKRHKFSGGRMTHGSMFHRAPGSIGCSAYPSRVIKGKKLPGHMGNESVTKKNCMIIDLIQDQNILIVKGSVPGAKNGILQIFTNISV